MCFPVAGALIGAAVSAAGSLYAGAQQSATYKAQAAADKVQARQTFDQGQYEVGRVKDKLNQTLGSQVASINGSGVQLSGSGLDAIGSSASEGQMDIDAIKWNALNTSKNLEYSAKVAKQNAKSATIGSFIGAAGGIAKSIGSIATNGTKLGNSFG